ncbi:MAG: MmcQ/YjbR family DNA-binding protein [Actinomycetota bacterium]
MSGRLDRLRKVCTALPEVTEEVTWETDITFRVNKKMFAITGPDAAGVTLKAAKSEQAALVASAAYIQVAAYVGRFGWVSVDLMSAPWDEVVELVRESYRLVAPKKLAALVD